MKTLNKLNLAYLNRKELDDREMNALRGGGPDSYYCLCNNCVSVSMAVNQAANAVYGYTNSGGGGYPIVCGCDNSAPMANVRGSHD